jgi:DNA invertase Pin-like site-specific DNA recombinase
MNTISIHFNIFKGNDEEEWIPTANVSGCEVDVREDKNPCAKLTAEEVLKIFEIANAGVPQKEIAEIFNISQSTVSRIKTGKRWAHLTGITPEKSRSENPAESTPITINLNFWFGQGAI